MYDLFEVRRAYKLPHNLARLMIALLTHRCVTPVMIEEELKIAADGWVAIHRLRSKLKPFGIKIESMRHGGYWLSPETKQSVAEKIGTVVADAA